MKRYSLNLTISYTERELEERGLSRLSEEKIQEALEQDFEELVKSPAFYSTEFSVTDEEEEDKTRRKKMEFNFCQHIDSYIEVVVEADNAEQAEELARVAMMDMPDEEFTKQVIANVEADSEIFSV